MSDDNKKPDDEEVPLIVEAFYSLRDPASDPAGFGLNWTITTAEIEDQEHFVLCAVHHTPEGPLLLPVFFTILPGTEVVMRGQTFVAKSQEEMLAEIRKGMN